MNSEQIAIDALNYFKVTLGNDVYSEFVGVFDIAIKATEKRIPKKVHKHHSLYKGICPDCLSVEDNSANFCRVCGKALDWSDNNV